MLQYFVLLTARYLLAFEVLLNPSGRADWLLTKSQSVLEAVYLTAEQKSVWLVCISRNTRKGHPIRGQFRPAAQTHTVSNIKSLAGGSVPACSAFSRLTLSHWLRAGQPLYFPRKFFHTFYFCASTFHGPTGEDLESQRSAESQKPTLTLMSFVWKKGPSYPGRFLCFFLPRFQKSTRDS